MDESVAPLNSCHNVLPVVNVSHNSISLLGNNKQSSYVTVRRNESAPTFYQIMQPSHSPHPGRNRGVKRITSLYSRSRTPRDRLSLNTRTDKNDASNVEESAQLLPLQLDDQQHMEADVTDSIVECNPMVDVIAFDDLHEVTILARHRSSNAESLKEEDENFSAV